MECADAGDISPGEEQIELTTLVESPNTNPFSNITTSGYIYSFARQRRREEPSLDEKSWMPLHPTKYKLEERLKSFTKWPPQMSPRPDELAHAGFFYSGSSDYVYCFHCGVALKNWEMTDNAFEEHKKWSPKCKFLQMISDL